MSQKIIIVILGLVIVAGGGAWYYQNTMMENGTGTTGGRTAKSAQEDKSVFDSVGKSISGSFAEIIGSGDSVQCKFSGTDPETNEPMDGVVYIAGEDYKMEADTVIEGTEARINVIQNGSVMYMWSDDPDAMPAIKIDVSMFPKDESAPAESPIDWLKDPESGVDYSCRDWSQKSDSFTPPEDIEFLDMFGAMFGGMMGAMMGGGEGEGGMFGGMMGGEMDTEADASVDGGTAGMDDWEEPSY
jgi:hypothetical protein